MSLQIRRKPREQFDLFTFEQIHIVDDFEKGGVWVCECGTIQTELFHCSVCKAEPPGGCQCPQCADLTTFWESEDEGGQR